jgi:hypothetical protein
MTSEIIGRHSWSLGRDRDGHRSYVMQTKVRSNDSEDGPSVILTTPGLPAIGSTWSEGNDIDAYAYCWPTVKISQFGPKGEPDRTWLVENKFTTEPLTRCQTTTIENPLLEPHEIGGSFLKYRVEATHDRNGVALLNSAGQQFRGSIIERDKSHPTIRIGKNFSTLPLSTYAPMIDTVNDSALWGLPARCIKLSNASFERRLFGTCTYYYNVTYEFDVDYSTFDREILDHGTKVLKSGGTSDNPRDYNVAKDNNGENTEVLLDGSGNVLTSFAAPYVFDVEFYDESNFLLLGIPTSL